MTERLLTAREVAELLGVSTATVLRLAREERLPSLRLAGETRPVRFRWSDIEARLEERGSVERQSLREAQ